MAGQWVGHFNRRLHIIVIQWVGGRRIIVDSAKLLGAPVYLVTRPLAKASFSRGAALLTRMEPCCSGARRRRTP